MANRAFAVAVFVRIPQGVVCVRDIKKPPPHFWKFPGGKGECIEGVWEDPDQAAVREVYGETGLTLQARNLTLVDFVNRGDHDFYWFTANITSSYAVNEMRKQGDEYEEVGVFPEDELCRMPDFFPPHRPFLTKHLSVTLSQIESATEPTPPATN